MPDNQAHNPKRVLCTAEAFGYGPASKLVALLHWFAPPQPVEFTFVGDGIACELCRTGPFNRYVCGNPTDLGQHSPFQRELAGHQAIISAMEFMPLASARRAGLVTVLFDSLFWFWPEMPCNLDDVDLYLCQNFVGVKERGAACGRSNLLVTPPLTLAVPAEGGGGSVVVMNLGGMDNPFAPREKLIAYAICMFGLTSEACRYARLSLEVYGRRWIVEELRQRFPGSAAVFDSLPPTQFLDRLRRACCLITSPGLEVLYEAFTLGVPVFLLPPQNNSQAYQAQCLQEEIPLLPGPQYPELIGTCPLARSVPPAQAIRDTLQCAVVLHECPSAHGRLRAAIEEFLCTGQYQALRRSESEFVERMRLGADIPSLAGLQERLAQTLWP